MKKFLFIPLLLLGLAVVSFWPAVKTSAQVVTYKDPKAELAAQVIADHVTSTQKTFVVEQDKVATLKGYRRTVSHKDIIRLARVTKVSTNSCTTYRAAKVCYSTNKILFQGVS